MPPESADELWRCARKRVVLEQAKGAPSPVESSLLLTTLTWAVAMLVAVRSIQPARNLLSRNQIMNTTYDPFHLVNSYGAFGSITRPRYEIVLQGTHEDTRATANWRDYEFRGKPGDPRRLPPQIAPYHLRLDWLMWFAAMPSPYYPSWFIHLLGKILAGMAPRPR